MSPSVSRSGRHFLLALIFAALGAAAVFLPPGFGRWQLELVAELLPTGHPRATNSVALDVPGDLLASASEDGSVRLWSRESHQAVAQVQLDSPVHQVLFLADKESLGMALANGRVALWNPAFDAPEYLVSTADDGSPILQLTASDDGKWLAASDQNGRLRLWDLDHYESAPAIYPSTSQITALTFAPQGRELALALRDGHLRRLRTPDLKPIEPAQQLPGESSAVALAYNPQAQVLWLLGASSLASWNLLDATLDPAATPDSEALIAIQPLADRLLLLDSAGSRFSQREGDETWSAQSTNLDASRAASWNHSGELLVVGGNDGIVRSWQSSQPAKVQLYGAPPLTVTTTKNGGLVASSHGAGILGPGRIELRNATGHFLAGVDLPAPPPTCLVFVGQDRRLEAWHHRTYLGSWLTPSEPLDEHNPAARRLTSTELPAAEPSCRRNHDRRFYTEVIRAVDGQDLVLQDSRNGWLTDLSDRYLQVTDVARRSPADRLLGRFSWVGLRDDRALVIARVQPQWPTGLLLLAAVGWIPIWRLSRRLLQRAGRVIPTRAGSRRID